MDEYWSAHRCGWAPCRGRHDAHEAPWAIREEEPRPGPELVLPQQREPRAAVVEA